MNGPLFETRYASIADEEKIIHYIYEYLKEQEELQEQKDIYSLVKEASKEYREFSCFAIKKIVWYLISTGDLILTSDRKIKLA